jgi:hypothetical protein
MRHEASRCFRNKGETVRITKLILKRTVRGRTSENYTDVCMNSREVTNLEIIMRIMRMAFNNLEGLLFAVTECA